MELSSSGFKEFLKQHQKITDQKCPKHGCNLVEFDKPEPHLVCTECQKEELTKKEHDMSANAVKCLKKRRTTDVLKKDSIITDDSLKNASFDNFEVDNDETKQALHLAKQIAYKYMTTDEQFNTLFTGQPGRGKSHLALSMLKAINDNSQKPVSCLFVSIDELFRKIKESFNYRESKFTEENMVSLLTRVDLLVMDDLGSEASMKRDNAEASDFVQRVLFGIFNSRTRTIITTNLNSKELSSMYNPKLISRMEKNVKGHIIKFTEATNDKRMVEF
ncbi:ATP-binding protein [Apilactobacillus micheneri]|uniref:ATP-binding protein n=1 Tax=Apilactobacillus micheneri TaxID=1899430 RepID=UPI001125D3DD|nr:ATP-binding protein [Apilactobacillus micheneri]TPR43182.1 ATP-binding protein [Apilactobacillus micheneri]TPR46985.1 ATP-binding protein [Apilactobacillus micheneri]